MEQPGKRALEREREREKVIKEDLLQHNFNTGKRQWTTYTKAAPNTIECPLEHGLILAEKNTEKVHDL